MQKIKKFHVLSGGGVAKKKAAVIAAPLLIGVFIIAFLGAAAPVVSADSDNNTLDLEDNDFTDNGATRYSVVGAPSYVITVSGTDPLTIRGNGTNGGNGWCIAVLDATEITLAINTKIVAPAGSVALLLLSTGNVTINGEGTSAANAPTISNIIGSNRVIYAMNGSVTFTGWVGNITGSNSIPCISAFNDVTITGKVGDLSGAHGITSGNNITISGTVGDINVVTKGFLAYRNITISGEVGDINSGETGIYSDGGSITVSGRVGDIDAGGSGIDAGRELLISGTVGNISAVRSGVYVNLGSAVISGKVESIAAGAGFFVMDIDSLYSYAVVGYTALDLSISMPSSPTITVTFDYGSLPLGGDMPLKAYLCGTNKIPKPTAPNYIVMDWFDNPAFTGDPWNFATRSATDGMTLYAREQTILNLSDPPNGGLTGTEGRFTVDAGYKLITVAGTDPLIIMGDGTNGGAGWSVLVSQATDITLRAGTKIIASAGYYALRVDASSVTITGMATSSTNAPTIKSATNVGIYANTGSVTIAGTVGNIEGREYGIWAMWVATISGTVGNIDARDNGIFTRLGSIIITGTVGNINVGIDGIRASQDATISGTVGNINAGGIGIWSEARILSITGTVGDISGATGIRAGWEVIISGTVGDINANDTYGIYSNTRNIEITGKVQSISAPILIRAVTSYAVLDYTGLSLTATNANPATAITVTFDYGPMPPAGDKLEKAYLAGTGINKIPAPTAPGYVAVQWFDNPEFNGSPWNFATDTATNGMTLYALDPNILHLTYPPNGGLTGTEGRFTVDDVNYTITVAGTDPLIIMGDGTNGGAGWTVIVSQATDITLRAYTKIVAGNDALVISSAGTTTINGQGTSAADAPTITSVGGRGIFANGGNIEITGTVGNVSAGQSGIYQVAGNVTISGTVGDITGYFGIGSANGITISGTVGNVSGFECGLEGGGGNITISGTVGNIHGDIIGIQATMGTITISGKVASISGGANPIAGWTAASSYAVLDYTGLDLTDSVPGTAITVTFNYGTTIAAGDLLLMAYLARADKIPVPTAPGYDLQDWYDVTAGRTLWNFAADTATDGLTLYTINEVTFTAVQTGGVSLTADSTGIEITFSDDVFGLTLADITVTNGTGTITTGALTEATGTGTGSVWTIKLTKVQKEGDVTVEIANFGRFDVLTAAQTLDVYKNTTPGSFTITSSSDANSVISPAGTKTVQIGGSATFTFSAKTGYHISSVTVDGIQLGEAQIKAGTYTFSNVTADHSISVTSAVGPGTGGGGDDKGGDDPGTGETDDASEASGISSISMWAIAIGIITVILCIVLFAVKRAKSS